MFYELVVPGHVVDRVRVMDGVIDGVMDGTGSQSGQGHEWDGVMDGTGTWMGWGHGWDGDMDGTRTWMGQGHGWGRVMDEVMDGTGHEWGHGWDGVMEWMGSWMGQDHGSRNRLLLQFLVLMYCFSNTRYINKNNNNNISSVLQFKRFSIFVKYGCPYIVSCYKATHEKQTQTNEIIKNDSN